MAPSAVQAFRDGNNNRRGRLASQTKIESRLSDEQWAENQRKDNKRRAKKMIAVIPYLHKISHNLKKVGQRSGDKVVFMVPNKLLALS